MLFWIYQIFGFLEFWDSESLVYFALRTFVLFSAGYHFFENYKKKNFFFFLWIYSTNSLLVYSIGILLGSTIQIFCFCWSPNNLLSTMYFCCFGFLIFFFFFLILVSVWFLFSLVSGSQFLVSTFGYFFVSFLVSGISLWIYRRF